MFIGDRTRHKSGMLCNSGSRHMEVQKRHRLSQQSRPEDGRQDLELTLCLGGPVYSRMAVCRLGHALCCTPKMGLNLDLYSVRDKVPVAYTALAVHSERGQS